MFFFGFVLLVLYICFVFNWVYLISLINKTQTFFEFVSVLQEHQCNIIEMFNVYREFLYDNETKIMNNYTVDYLKYLEIEIYDKITEQSIKMDKFLLHSSFQLFELLNKDYCHYKETDIFNSLEECESKFGYIFKFHFHLFYNFFLEEIKINKNIVRYKLKNEKIIGDLANFNREQFINEYENDKNIELRLNLFNDEKLHFTLNLFFISVLLPNLRYNRKEIGKLITIEGEEYFFNEMIIIYSIELVLIFFGFLTFIIKKLNDQIYKAKNMLSIFPINILASQNNNEYMVDLFANN
jgi:hypothetical protein